MLTATIGACGLGVPRGGAVKHMDSRRHPIIAANGGRCLPTIAAACAAVAVAAAAAAWLLALGTRRFGLLSIALVS